MKRFRFSLSIKGADTVSRGRRGVAVLVVLLLLAMTLGLSYAAMRSQHTAMLIHRNFDRRSSARQAAMTGLTLAIKKMHTADWQGVGSTLDGSLGEYEGFTVTYTLGDPTLSAGHADYEAYPYRVTLLSTGTAVDPSQSAAIAKYRIRAVVELSPRNMAAEPTDWATMQDYTVYQTNDDYVALEIPCRIEGPVRLQEKLRIADVYPNDTEARLKYLQDLNAMRLAGLPDFRPFNGPVHFRCSDLDASYFDELIALLGMVVIDVPKQEVASDWREPVSLTDYQIYEGGPIYTIPHVSGILENVTLEADPLNNPLGIVYCDTSITIRDNVTIHGSLFCRDDINIEGTKVVFLPVDLPSLNGSDVPVRLPVASCQNFLIKPLADATVRGLVAVFDRFEVERSHETTKLDLLGRLITRRLYLMEREPWDLLYWNDHYANFSMNLALGDPPLTPYFPVWMQAQGRDPIPRITIRPDPGPNVCQYHWYDQDDPIYLPHPDDDALRWDLLEWTENPQ